MPSRDDLKSLIDQVPETRPESARQILERLINPPTLHLKPPTQHFNPQTPNLEIELMQRRAHEYREQVLRRFRETRKSGTFITAGSGSSGFGTHQGVSFGCQSFHYWDDKALVYQSLQFFDGQSIELMERLSFSPDRTAFLCSLELSSGGHIVHHEDRFPIATEGE